MNHKKPRKNTDQPSEQLINKIVAAFRNHHNEESATESKVAELTTDTPDQFVRHGARGAAASRELFYRGKQISVALSINADDTGHLNTLRGQIFLEQKPAAPEKKSPEGIILSVHQLRGDTHRTIADSSGRFRLSNLDKGTYRIDIQSSNENLLIEKLVI